MLNGIKNFLTLVNENWTTIVVCISLLVALIRKIKAYIEQSDDQKIEVAKKHIRESMLKLITDAELDYENWNKAGSVKRSQVIKEIFKEYPILSKMVNQDELIAWIDMEINTALVELRKIVADNAPQEE